MYSLTNHAVTNHPIRSRSAKISESNLALNGVPKLVANVCVVYSTDSCVPVAICIMWSDSAYNWILQLGLCGDKC